MFGVGGAGSAGETPSPVDLQGRMDGRFRGWHEGRETMLKDGRRSRRRLGGSEASAALEFAIGGALMVALFAAILSAYEIVARNAGMTRIASKVGEYVSVSETLLLPELTALADLLREHEPYPPSTLALTVSGRHRATADTPPEGAECWTETIISGPDADVGPCPVALGTEFEMEPGTSAFHVRVCANGSLLPGNIVARSATVPAFVVRGAPPVPRLDASADLDTGLC